jgi:hypothetical protein
MVHECRSGGKPSTLTAVHTELRQSGRLIGQVAGWDLSAQFDERHSWSGDVGSLPQRKYGKQCTRACRQLSQNSTQTSILRPRNKSADAICGWVND